MSKNHIGVTTKLQKYPVAELELEARKQGMKRSALIRKCLLDFLAAQSKDEFPPLIAQNQKSSVA
jgi:hypothetical protein